MANVIDLDSARNARCAAEERVPPQDPVAEQTVLADVLLGGIAHLARVKDFLRPEHFYSEANRQIYAACVDVMAAGEPVDTTTVLSRLKQQDRIAQVGGAAYVTESLHTTAAVANIVPHARIVHDRWRDRELIAAAQRIAARGYLGVEDTQAFADDAVRSLAAIANGSVTVRVESNEDAMKRILKAISERAAAKTKVPLGLPTQIASYDEEWGGLHSGEVTTIVARPGVGKTSIAIQLLATITQTVGVAMFSQDSSRDELLTDLLSHVAKVDGRAFRKGEIDIDMWRRIAEASQALGERKYWIDDSRKIHVGTVRARSLALADESMKRSRVPLGLIIVDYIQQLVAPPNMERSRKHEWLGHAATELKSLARQMNIPIVVLAQQKRDYNGKAVWEASDCSEIEKEADNLFFIEKTAPTSRRLRCWKVRRGAQRTLDLAFDGPTRTFSDARHEPESRRYIDRARAATTPAARNEPPENFFDHTPEEP